MAKISQLGATGRKATFLDVLPNDEQTIIYIYFIYIYIYIYITNKIVWETTGIIIYTWLMLVKLDVSFQQLWLQPGYSM